MGWFRNLFGKKKKNNGEPPRRDSDSLNRSVGYMYLIIGSQLLLVFVIMAIMMFVGAVISTPWWIFAGIFIMGLAVSWYLYQKARRKWEELKTAFKQINLSDKNYEISIMGGMLTMRVEHHPHPVMAVSASREPLPKALPSPAEDELPSEEREAKGEVLT